MGWGASGGMGLALWCSVFGWHGDVEELMDQHEAYMWISHGIVGQPWVVRGTAEWEWSQRPYGLIWE